MFYDLSYHNSFLTYLQRNIIRTVKEVLKIYDDVPRIYCYLFKAVEQPIINFLLQGPSFVASNYFLDYTRVTSFFFSNLMEGLLQVQVSSSFGFYVSVSGSGEFLLLLLLVPRSLSPNSGEV